ncbi:MAG: flagellar export chaperone FliS [Fibrobacterota bacterium]
MSSLSGYKAYKTANVNTTDQGKLILMTYDLAIKSCMQAVECIGANDLSGKTKKLYKAQDCVTELRVALDHEKGGEIAANLEKLYEYFDWRITQANIKNDTAMVTEVKNHLTELRKAWAEAIKKTRETGAAPEESTDNSDNNGLKMVG